MKKINIYQIMSYIVLIAIAFLVSCTPDEISDTNVHVLDKSTISRVVLKPSHSMIIPNGKAVIDLTPMVYAEYNGVEALVSNERITDDMLEYSSDLGKEITRYFSTTDVSLVGKTIDVSVSIKGTSVKSESVTIKVVSELSSLNKKATFPIVFHIIRAIGEEDKSGLKLEKEVFYKQIEKLNNIFGATNTSYPVAADTHIQFKPAIYAPSGEKMNEPGVNRVSYDATTFKTNDLFTVVEDNNLLWDPTKYLNIWILEYNKLPGYSLTNYFTKKCIPRYKYETATGVPEGVNLENYNDSSAFTMNNGGIYYNLESLFAIDRPYSVYYGFKSGANDLAFYVGNYFGLLPNNVFRAQAPNEDYCDDTIGYYISSDFYKKNKSPYKETSTNFFLSQNIMDDPTGFHTAISQEQAKRIWWFLENSPERSAWKSSYAFNGK